MSYRKIVLLGLMFEKIHRCKATNRATYTDLAPNIAKSGVFVYNVPADSVDYYISILKADTDDGYHLYAK